MYFGAPFGGAPVLKLVFFLCIPVFATELRHCPDTDPSGQRFIQGGYLLYPDGSRLKDGSSWYYPSSERLIDGDTWRYPTGYPLIEGNIWRYLSGRPFRERSTLYYREGKVLREGKVFRYEDGTRGRFSRIVIAESTHTGVINFIAEPNKEIIRNYIMVNREATIIVDFESTSRSFQPTWLTCRFRK